MNLQLIVKDKIKKGLIVDAITFLIDAFSSSIEREKFKKILIELDTCKMIYLNARKDFLIGVISEEKFQLTSSKTIKYIIEILASLRNNQITEAGADSIKIRNKRSNNKIENPVKVELVFNQTSIPEIVNINSNKLNEVFQLLQVDLKSSGFQKTDKFSISFNISYDRAKKVKDILDEKNLKRLGIQNVRYFFTEKDSTQEGKLKAVIVEDEQAGINNLKRIILEYCPEIEIIKIAKTVAEAIRIIYENKPQLVFMDISLPDGLAFGILESFEEIFFEVIFVTAYSEYAIKACDFASVGYLLKPIDPTLLVFMVRQARKNIETYSASLRYHLFKKALINDIKTIAVQTSFGIIFIELSDIVVISEKDDSTEIVLIGGRVVQSHESLKKYDNLLTSHLEFIRVNKYHIINEKHIEKLETKNNNTLVNMRENLSIQISKRRLEIIRKRIEHQ